MASLEGEAALKTETIQYVSSMLDLVSLMILCASSKFDSLSGFCEMSCENCVVFITRQQEDPPVQLMFSPWVQQNMFLQTKPILWRNAQTSGQVGPLL